MATKRIGRRMNKRKDRETTNVVWKFDENEQTKVRKEYMRSKDEQQQERSQVKSNLEGVNSRDIFKNLITTIKKLTRNRK